MSTREQLQATLKELQAELDSLDSLDDPTRTMLESAVQDIQTTLRAKTDDESTEDTESLVSGLRDAIDRFESSHPTLTGILSRLVDMLGQMGI
jgi:chromosome segregation ATPase